MVNIMKTLKVGESQNKSTVANVELNVVNCVHATVHPSLNDQERLEMLWTISFEDMTEEQILEAAAEHFLIKIRRTFAKVEKPKNNDWHNITFKAIDHIAKRVSKVDKMVKTLADFSDEQLAALGLIRSE